jgi:hypothetical protein
MDHKWMPQHIIAIKKIFRGIKKTFGTREAKLRGRLRVFNSSVWKGQGSKIYERRYITITLEWLCSIFFPLATKTHRPDETGYKLQSDTSTVTVIPFPGNQPQIS